MSDNVTAEYVSERIDKDVVESLAKRTLRFQRFELRKAYGKYYAVWSAIFILYLPMGSILYFLRSPYWFYPIPYVVSSVVGLCFTISIFRRASLTAILRSSIRPHTFNWKLNALFWIFMGIYSLAVVIASIFFYELGLVILYVSLYFVPIYLYVGLKRSFSNQVPSENWVALVSYLVGDTVSIILTATNEFFLLTVAWVLVGIVWAYGSYVSYFRAKDELTVDSL